jgi:hypothetical protein
VRGGLQGLESGERELSTIPPRLRPPPHHLCPGGGPELPPLPPCPLLFVVPPWVAMHTPETLLKNAYAL